MNGEGSGFITADGDQASARAQGCLGAKARRPRHVGGACPDQHPAVIPLMAVTLAGGKPLGNIGGLQDVIALRFPLG